MNPELVLSVLTLASGAISVYVGLRLRASIAEQNLKAEQDKAETRQWINGAFLRAPVIEAKYEALDTKVDDLDRRVGMHMESIQKNLDIKFAGVNDRFHHLLETMGSHRHPDDSAPV